MTNTFIKPSSKQGETRSSLFWHYYLKKEEKTFHVLTNSWLIANTQTRKAELWSITAFCDNEFHLFKFKHRERQQRLKVRWKCRGF